MILFLVIVHQTNLFSSIFLIRLMFIKNQINPSDPRTFGFPLCVFSQFDYYNSMMINSPDEDGNYPELGGEFPLEENEHFNNLPVNTQQSDIQVPTNVYNKGQRSS